LEPNKQRSLVRAISTVSTIGGYIIGSVLIGMYLDNKFFNNNGIAIIIACVIGIIGVVYNVIKLVILSRDN